MAPAATKPQRKEFAILRLILRNLLLLVVLVPALNLLGFYYGIKNGPLPFYAEALPQDITLEDLEALRPQFGPAYRDYVSGVRQGDWGSVQNTPLRAYLPRFLNRSLVLIGWSLLTALVLGPLLGTLAISRRTGRISRPALAVFTVGSAVPGFFLGTLLITFLLFASRSGWFGAAGLPLPVQGYGVDAHLVLPVLTLAIRPVIYVGYLTAGLLEHELQQDYIRVARGKGLRWGALLWRHALPNAASAVITTLGRALQMVIGGLILVEPLFDWRGAGWLLIDALTKANSYMTYFNPALLALLLPFFGAMLIVTDLISSLWAYLADPRLRQASAAVVR